MTGAPRAEEAAPQRSGRGEERRGQILEATIRLIATRGLGTVTHRAVAREAGVPLAATTYYFESKSELVTEALRTLAESEVAQLRERIAELEERIASEPLAAISILAEVLMPRDRNAEQAWLAQFEIYLEAARNESLRPVVASWREAFVTLAESSLRAAGCPEPERRAPLLVAGVNGILLDRLRGIGDDPERTMLERAGELFTLLTGAPQAR